MQAFTSKKNILILGVIVFILFMGNVSMKSVLREIKPSIEGLGGEIFRRPTYIKEIRIVFPNKIVLSGVKIMGEDEDIFFGDKIQFGFSLFDAIINQCAKLRYIVVQDAIVTKVRDVLFPLKNL